MTPEEFIRKWGKSELKESAGAQQHFLDLCALLDEPTPAQVDATGERFCFEKGATKSTGGQGFADVWKRGHFGWEYKGPNKDLNGAYRQLLTYSVALENPPLLIVSDTKKIVIRTNWTNTIQEAHALELDDLLDAGKRDLLKAALSDPERLKPKKTRTQLTADAADEFSSLAQRLRDRGHEPHQVAHFVNRLVFCMFAEDVGVLPNKLFQKALERSEHAPEKADGYLQRLFAAMQDGGEFGLEEIPWFNGGLFDSDETLPLEADDVALALKAAKLDWQDIDPSILGTLFERGLDPSKRSQLGAHYTNRDKIMMIVNPVIVEPLTTEWEKTKKKLAGYAEKLHEADAAIADVQAEAAAAMKKGEGKKAETARQKKITKLRSQGTKAQNAGQKLYEDFLERLRNFRVLDPACGSGNFLNLSLTALKDLEHKANLDAEAMGFKRRPPRVGPEAVKGIEINPYAAELARVSIWVGEIQWMRRNGFDVNRNPILRVLGSIECRDAIIERLRNDQWKAAGWPPADVIIGNPPYLGAKLMKRRLGVPMTEAIRNIYDGRLPGFTDLVCYWFENARVAIESGATTRAGLVATNSIRKNTNLPVMQRITETTRIYEAWPEEQWDIEGAAVDVSLICFGDNKGEPAKLNGEVVEFINPDLTSGLNLTLARALPENKNGAFLGIQKSGPFDVSGDIARSWMQEPINPNRKTNADVLKPYWNGDDVTSRPRDVWFIDLPLNLSKGEASLFATPFHHLATTPDEDGKTVEELREALGDRAGPRWWEPHWPRPEMRSRIEQLSRYIATPETALHRLFVWLSYPILPDKNLIVIPRDDDTTFGILHSVFHQVWAIRKGSDLEDRPRYTHTSTFATFPFPEGLTPDIPAKKYADDPQAKRIAKATAKLNELRENWLNPPDLVKRVPEDVEGYPDRILPVDEKAEKVLKKRTLTNLYNERPAWLDNAHKALDEAVAAAYGWEDDFKAGALTNEEILKRLFELNQERAAKQES